ncbi:hypothetical protein KAX02_02000 [candidate division WOR-3 bacterium]|nr:hypothetical protein [candidate division WOR-3 bacterium]
MSAPNKLVGLYQLLDNIDRKDATINIEELHTATDCFMKYIRNVYNLWFPRVKEYNDKQIAEQIFVKEIEIKDRVSHTKYELCALIKSFQRTIETVDCDWRRSGDTVELRDELRVLKSTSFEAITFIDLANYYVKGKFAGYGFWKRLIVTSIEPFSASKMLLRNKIYKDAIGTFVIPPTSIFLIRQAIELRLKNAFGIDMITDNNGKILRIPGNRFIELLKDIPNDVIKFPVKRSLVMKIHKWSNYYIHAGFIPYTWEIEWAHYILDPLFSIGHFEQTWSLFGTIQIKKDYYNQIETEIKRLISSYLNINIKNIVVHRAQEPECLLVHEKIR